MNINIIGRQVHVTDDLKELVAKKLSKFDRYFPKGADATVTFRRVRDNECMEITISVVGTLFRAEESSADFRTSLARCIDVIEGQIRKNKTRLEKRMKSSFAAAEAAMAVQGEPVEEEGEFDIRTKTFPLKPMTPEEAILQMNLLGHAFYVFADADTGDTCIVYKRNAGAYGLIVPEKKEG
ncbi:MAG: ribosome-associated translation inhibitor RaiA [Ruminococcaceae bacterium]|nr:ribosome-associated translation inhibitor RaiA [Oscillospiraceae bacterium]